MRCAGRSSKHDLGPPLASICQDVCASSSAYAGPPRTQSRNDPTAADACWCRKRPPPAPASSILWPLGAPIKAAFAGPKVRQLGCTTRERAVYQLPARPRCAQRGRQQHRAVALLDTTACKQQGWYCRLAAAASLSWSHLPIRTKSTIAAATAGQHAPSRWQHNALRRTRQVAWRPVRPAKCSSRGSK